MKKLLLVDDEVIVTDMLSAKLRLNGFDVVVANCGKQAVELAQIQRPDLIILDLMLPDINGYEVCRCLFDQPQTKNIPVIMLTASSDMADVRKGVDLGVVAYMTKPIEFNKLLGVLQGFI